MSRIVLYFSLIGLLSKLYGQSEINKDFILIDSVYLEKTNIRALIPEKDGVWYASDQGKFGYHDFSTNTTFEQRIEFDGKIPAFRSIAQTTNHLFLLSIGNPALLYKIDKKTRKGSLVYIERHEKVFYDSMKFWNDNEGIALGDPISDCFSVLITRDGGDSWDKLACHLLPKVFDGEAAFAASNTNIVIKDDTCWMVSGGVKARVFFSPDKGKSWTETSTPITHGQPMTGIFTADFYDEKIGFIAGGDYDHPTSASKNKARTTDGGHTWNLVSNNEGFGYASCVQYVPESKGAELISVGATGVWYSSNGGMSWRKLLVDQTLYTIAFVDGKTAYAAGKNKVIRIRFQK